MEGKSYPTFLGIGAQKAGTTWLYKFLKRHPDVWMPTVKELHYFDRSTKYPSPSHLTTEKLCDRIFTKDIAQIRRTFNGLKSVLRAGVRRDIDFMSWQYKWYFGNYNDKWYSGLYEQGMKYKARGEITPSYMMIDCIDIDSIKAINSEMRIIFIIRDPIERAWAGVKYKSKYSGVSINLEDDSQVIEQLKSPPFIGHGDYVGSINRFLSVFDRAQILLCFYDAIICDPKALLYKIFDFLGVDPDKGYYGDFEQKVNASSDMVMSRKVREYLESLYLDEIQILKEKIGGFVSNWGGGMSTCNDQLPVAIHPVKI